MKSLETLGRQGLLDFAKKHGIKLSKAARSNMGTLKAAIAKVAEPKPEAPAKALKAAIAKVAERGKQGQIVRSVEGVGVQAMWQRLFLQNEEAWAGRQQKLLLSDEQITEAMRSAFPGRESAIFTEVRRVRARWNRGAWGSSLKEDRPTSYRYVLNGDGKFHRTGSRGNPIE